MKISIIGVGYVGLVTGACFAEMGIKTSCIDIDKEKIDNLKKGIIPIWEPGLQEIVEKNYKKGNLEFTTNIKDSISNATACFIAVGTPSDEDGSADLQYVLSVAKEIGQNMTDYMIIITKSTVPVGTSKKVKLTIQEELDKRNLKINFDIASNPEFLKEGDAIKDCLYPDRIIVGTESDKARNTIEKLYKPFLLNGYPIIHMDIASAELTKYANNAMLATKISFINDIANLCEKVGADIKSIRKGIGSDQRIGHHFIYAGTGYGGSCFPKDIKALINISEANGHSLDLMKAVEKVNNRQKETLYHKAMQHFNNNINGKRFAIWGLSFKPNTDDMREAPSIVLINKLLEGGAIITASDPVAINEAMHKFGNRIEYTEDAYIASEGADAIFLVTEWSEYRLLNYKLLEKMKSKVIFDGRNIFDPIEVQEKGFKYYGIGIKTEK